MKLGRFIFISIFFMSCSLDCMEIIKKNKTKKKHTQHNSFYPITKELLFTHTMNKKKILLPELNDLIIMYCALLRNKEFENSTSQFISKWHDFRIPVSYHCCLSSKQMDLLQKLFTSYPYKYWIDGQRSVDYSLKSDKDYKLFLTLPIELRRCLTLLPLSEINNQKKFLGSSETEISNKINTNKTILVKDLSTEIVHSGLIILGTPNETHNIKHFGYLEKLIIPEDKAKNNPKKKLFSPAQSPGGFFVSYKK